MENETDPHGVRSIIWFARSCRYQHPVISQANELQGQYLEYILLGLRLANHILIIIPPSGSELSLRRQQHWGPTLSSPHQPDSYSLSYPLKWVQTTVTGTACRPIRFKLLPLMYTLRYLCAQLFVIVNLYDLLLATYPIPLSDVREHQGLIGWGWMPHSVLGLREWHSAMLPRSARVKSQLSPQVH